MLLPPGQRLPLRDLVDLLNQAHGVIRIVLVLQHLPDRLHGVFGQRPWLDIP